MQSVLFRRWRTCSCIIGGWAALLCVATPLLTQQIDEPKDPKKGTKGVVARDVGKSSYDQIAPVLIGKETFAQMLAKDKAGKAKVMARQMALLEERYDLSKRVDPKNKM